MTLSKSACLAMLHSMLNLAPSTSRVCVEFSFSWKIFQQMLL